MTLLRPVPAPDPTPPTPAGPRPLAALAAAVAIGLLGGAVWLAEGASYLLPLTIVPLFYSAWFFPPPMAWPLAALVVAVYGSPLAYDGGGTHAGGVAAFAFAAAVVTGFLTDLKRRLVEAELLQRTMAERDPLTGLGNRRAFDAALARELEVARAGDEGLALLVLDLDHFRLVNERFGHPAGDRVLRGVAAHCERVVRAGDTLARIGGDELALIAPACDAAGARRLAEALEHAVTRVANGPERQPMTAAVGWAVHGSDGRDAEELIRIADHRLYERKALRRNAAATALAGRLASR